MHEFTLGSFLCCDGRVGAAVHICQDCHASGEHRRQIKYQGFSKQQLQHNMQPAAGFGYEANTAMVPSKNSVAYVRVRPALPVHGGAAAGCQRHCIIGLAQFVLGPVL